MASKGDEVQIPTVDEIAKTNPKVDRDQFSEAATLIDGLRKKGLKKPQYRGNSPYDDRVCKT